MSSYLYSALTVCFYGLTYAFRVNLHSGIYLHSNSKYFFYNTAVGFGPGTCCFTKVVYDHERFPVNFQGS